MFGRWPREGVSGSVRAPLELKGATGEEVEVSGEEEGAEVAAGIEVEAEVVGGSAWDDDPGIALEAKSTALLRCTSEDMRPGGCSRTWPVPDALLLLLWVVDDPPPACALYCREPMLGDEEPDSACAGCVGVGSFTPLNLASTLLEGATIV
jgi:hypothetical protein